MKRYDKSYFDRWYRGSRRVHSKSEVRRKVALAVAVTEYFLRRGIRSVLDIGCGEGPWFSHLRELRPRVAYLGLDPSEYVVERFGPTRNIRRASFGELPSLDLNRSFDLVVCSDVLHYVPEGEIRAGLRAVARLAGGVAFFEVLTAEDDVVGDLEGLIRRPAAWYRNVLIRARFTPAGPYCWLAPAMRADAAALEINAG